MMEAILDAMTKLWLSEKQRNLEKIVDLQGLWKRQEQIAQQWSKSFNRPFAKTRGMIDTERRIAEAQEELKKLEARLREYEKLRKTTSTSSSSSRAKALQILGLPVNCTDAEKVRDAYRRLAKQHHPDAGGDAKAMAKINEAYRVLSEYAK